MDQGIPWPVSLGVAGGAVAALVMLLVWLIRRQASGEWYTAAQVTLLLAEKDKTIALHQTLANEWQGAHAKLAETHAETTTALNQSVEANRAADRAFDLLLQNAGVAPREGHNGRQTEGVSAQ